MKALVTVCLLASLAMPARAGNALIAANARVAVAGSTLTVAAGGEWNRLSARLGPKAETWTLDGDQLNAVTFYGGVPAGRTLLRDSGRRDRPLPRLKTTMLVTDVPAFLESSYRIALGTPLFAIDAIEPARLAGRPGIRFTYSFTTPGDDVPRRGEARAAIVDGRLYLITYQAPRLHFFDRSVSDFRQIADSARL